MAKETQADTKHPIHEADLKALADLENSDLYQRYFKDGITYEALFDFAVDETKEIHDCNGDSEEAKKINDRYFGFKTGIDSQTPTLGRWKLIFFLNKQSIFHAISEYLITKIESASTADSLYSQLKDMLHSMTKEELITKLTSAKEAVEFNLNELTKGNFEIPEDVLKDHNGDQAKATEFLNNYMHYLLGDYNSSLPLLEDDVVMLSPIQFEKRNAPKVEQKSLFESEDLTEDTPAEDIKEGKRGKKQSFYDASTPINSYVNNDAFNRSLSSQRELESYAERLENKKFSEMILNGKNQKNNLKGFNARVAVKTKKNSNGQLVVDKRNKENLKKALSEAGLESETIRIAITTIFKEHLYEVETIEETILSHGKEKKIQRDYVVLTGNMLAKEIFGDSFSNLTGNQQSYIIDGFNNNRNIPFEFFISDNEKADRDYIDRVEDSKLFKKVEANEESGAEAYYITTEVHPLIAIDDRKTQTEIKEKASKRRGELNDIKWYLTETPIFIQANNLISSEDHQQVGTFKHEQKLLSDLSINGTRANIITFLIREITKARGLKKVYVEFTIERFLTEMKQSNITKYQKTRLIDNLEAVLLDRSSCQKVTAKNEKYIKTSNNIEKIGKEKYIKHDNGLFKNYELLNKRGEVDKGTLHKVRLYI